MRLHINNHFFISVIQKENQYSCQTMNLIHGMGMYPAIITDNQKDIVSCIVDDIFTETNKTCNNLQEVIEFHTQCLLDLEIKQLAEGLDIVEMYNDLKNESELNSLENQSTE